MLSRKGRRGTVTEVLPRTEAPDAAAPVPDTDAAVRFLRQFAPEGPWVLTVIRPDRKGITTETFRPSTAVHNNR